MARPDWRIADGRKRHRDAKLNATVKDPEGLADTGTMELRSACSVPVVARRFLVILAAILAVGLPSAAQAAPLRTAILDPFSGWSPDVVAVRAANAGASMIRIPMWWSEVAPERPETPEDPRAYGDRAWARFDAEISAAARNGLDPIVYIQRAPAWAEGSGAGPIGSVRPDPRELGRFAQAAARRYDGTYVREDSDVPLPRVRYWMVWNEPNRDYYLIPQYQGARIVSAGRYRAMVNRFSAGVKTVDASNVVIAGGLAPLGRPGKPAPLAFMRSMLCISKTLRRTCDLRSSPIQFDVWSHHPYTSGGPTHRAPKADDVSLGDLGDMQRLLKGARKLGHIRSASSVGFWVTELSWDSSPPDPRGLSTNVHARWISEALYRVWLRGVSVVTWNRVHDEPLARSPFQSGFYTVDGREKRSLRAFRFPTVGFARKTGIYVWGRTATSSAGPVAIELKVGSRWRPLGTLQAASTGIFRKTFASQYAKGYVRARFAGETSLPFALTPVPDRYVNPFGCGGGIPC